MLIEIAHAGSQTGIFSERMDLGDFILLAISVIVLFAGVFSLLYILWGGLLLILSGGKEEKMKPAFNSIRYALIGLGIIVISIFIFPRLAGLLGLDVSKYSSPDQIFKEIKVIGDKIFGGGGTSNQYNTTPGGGGGLPDDFSDL